MEIIKENKNFIFKSFLVFIFVFVLIYIFYFSFGKNFDKNEIKDEKTITVNGMGEVNAVPDLANISFTISKTGKTVKEAGAEVKEIQDKVMSTLKNNKIEEKDIKTSNISFYPKYDYENKMMPCTMYDCPPRNQVISGYTYSLNISVKIRNTDDVGKVIEDLGKLGLNDLSGPNFSIDDEKLLKQQARKKAIDEARKEAEILARDLGVRLVSIVSFSESNNNYPYPMYAKMSMDSIEESGSSSMEIPKGENTITSNVVITYKIK